MSDYITIRVRGYHIDQHGQVHDRAHTEFLEEARWTLFENFNAIDFFSKLDLALTIVSNHINYRRPCFLNDTLEIHTRVMRIGKASCKMEQKIFLEGTDTVIVDATNIFVLTDKKNYEAIQIEGSAREKLEQLANAS